MSCKLLLPAFPQLRPRCESCRRTTDFTIAEHHAGQFHCWPHRGPAFWIASNGIFPSRAHERRVALSSVQPVFCGWVSGVLNAIAWATDVYCILLHFNAIYILYKFFATLSRVWIIYWTYLYMHVHATSCNILYIYIIIINYIYI